MSLAPRDHRAQGRRLVLRFAGLQLAATLVAALIALALGGVAAARAALAGGLVVAVGNVVFGFRLFAPGVAPVRVLARAFFGGEALKWVWLGLALWAALGPARLAPLPLLGGLVAAQFGFWLGLAVIR
jgi:F0F1-type ATP synthase assembly protein I